MQPGSQLAHYQIVEKIGEGGMGVVYKARDLKLERFVALKVLPATMLADPERVRRFEQEAKTASALNHPNIVTIHDIAEQDGVRFIVMEFIKGQTLDRLIPAKGMPRTQALSIAVQVADAVAAAAASGVTHRDLKPGNIMITDSGLVKLLDFGLAKLTERVAISADDATVVAAPKTKEGVIAGTVDYMSPEQAEGRTIDARSDIFSFGTVLYEMLSGTKPFVGATPMAVLGAIMHQEPKAVSGMPEEFSKLLARALRKDPDRRFQTMADLRVALVELKEGSASGLQTAPNGKPRSMRWVVLAAAGVAIAALSLWMGSRARTGTAPATAMRAVPLTALEGLEQQPTFSPDGNQVAFAWQRTPEAKFAIHVKMLSGGAPVRLTTGEENEYCPQWSPDGQWIAFTRRDPTTKTSVLHLLSPVSRQERRLLDTESSSTACLKSWHPHGKKLVVRIAGQDGGLYAVSVENGQKQRLTPPEIRQPSRPAISPDGRHLVFHGVINPAFTLASHIGILDLSEDMQPIGAVRQLLQLSTVNSISWLPEGDALLVSTSSDSTRLLRVPVSGGEAQTVEVSGLGSGFTDFAVTRTQSGTRLAITQVEEQINIWRQDIDERGKGVGKPVKLFSTTQREDFPAWSPDGNRIAFSSFQTGKGEVWVANADGSNMAQLTRDEQNTKFLFWSPDGARLLRGFGGGTRRQGTIEWISPTDGAVHKIPTRAHATHAQSWSRDGASVYFTTHDAGAEGVWRVRMDGSTEEKILDGDVHCSAESLDGRDYYYLRDGIWKKPLSGPGAAVRVVPPPAGAFSLTKEGIFYRRGRNVYFHHLARNTEELSFTTTGPVPQLDGVISVTTDGRIAAVANVESSNRDLMLVENFR